MAVTEVVAVAMGYGCGLWLRLGIFELADYCLDSENEFRQ